MKQVCISFDEQNLKNLDYMLKSNLFPTYIKNRSQAINYLVSEVVEKYVGSVFDSHSGNFKKY